ncbi:hypothetical protein CDAR_534481 [Caerostris darwini]|uniref:Uncharacterized protein n=1 Tax=Caerostris darwini TaxID=1538125 RepID=A0AAV4MIE4_9ARAC|nr:hypothetical protein CDAR_534481 [Caerostris darwini]
MDMITPESRNGNAQMNMMATSKKHGSFQMDMVVPESKTGGVLMNMMVPYYKNGGSQMDKLAPELRNGGTQCDKPFSFRSAIAIFITHMPRTAKRGTKPVPNPNHVETVSCVSSRIHQKYESPPSERPIV